MAISNLYHIASNTNNRKSVIDRRAIPGRKLSIELLPNQAVFRETFIGTGSPRQLSPPYTPVDDSGPSSPFASPSPSRAISTGQVCTACNSLVNSPELRKIAVPAPKRTAVIIPTARQYSGPRTPGVGGRPPLNSLPSIGEDSYVAWERRGSVAIPISIPSPACTPFNEGGDYFANAMAARLGSSSGSMSPMGSMPSPRGYPMAGSPRGQRPSLLATAPRNHRACLRVL